MNLSPQRSEDPDVNLTPMIDVVFLLLLFFMVSTSFIRESSLKVNLPEATGEAMVEQDKPVDIVIQADGQFLVNEESLPVVSREILTTVLKRVVGERDDPHIIISADANAEYQHIVTAMDTAQQLGYTKLTLATRQTKQETP
ncbi:Biopolymer transport protein ExbD/TolR [Methylophaga thiooxydans]|uniref:Biopolymer transport protein ExbD/TolR n=2 Tax=Methylophaga thiooxydans TaxID=392484 RepID=A0A0A0BI17_9GAMM|nr:biopolymer transporter ExbD [Methylophaga thiooxydans]KGM07307.1 Biopolymer transport protein ExbD/TolR [Methylophaga thiooxydans]